MEVMLCYFFFGSLEGDFPTFDGFRFGEGVRFFLSALPRSRLLLFSASVLLGRNLLRYSSLDLKISSRAESSCI